MNNMKAERDQKRDNCIDQGPLIKYIAELSVCTSPPGESTGAVRSAIFIPWETIVNGHACWSGEDSLIGNILVCVPAICGK